jgi:hypothetical protein
LDEQKKSRLVLQLRLGVALIMGTFGLCYLLDGRLIGLIALAPSIVGPVVLISEYYRDRQKRMRKESGDSR